VNATVFAETLPMSIPDIKRTHAEPMASIHTDIMVQICTGVPVPHMPCDQWSLYSVCEVCKKLG
jgi:hypothetical protein